MTENRKPSILNPDDDAPDLSTPEWQEKFAKVPWTRGRPKLETPKVLTSLRIDPDVLSFFQKDGPGWRTRVNEALRAAMLGHPAIKKARAKAGVTTRPKALSQKNLAPSKAKKAASKVASAKRAKALPKKAPARKRA
jgi:uncharacterized protein (DUF4415 family)